MCSMFSGKCDICDVLVGIHADGDPNNLDFSKIKIYAAGNDVIPLRIDCVKDLIPYYPYLQSMGSGSKDGGQIIHLSEESFVDREEKSFLQYRLDNCLKYYRKCKREKKEFDVEQCLKYSTIHPQAYDYEIANRVNLLGAKATIDNIHMPSHDRMREELYKEMILNGYDEMTAYRWCFGWERLFKKMKEEDKENE